MALTYEKVMEGREDVLAEMAARLERVRSWGGGYRCIELSPDIEHLIRKKEAAEQDQRQWAMVET